jgi:hypothetical protein
METSGSKNLRVKHVLILKGNCLDLLLELPKKNESARNTGNRVPKPWMPLPEIKL